MNNFYVIHVAGIGRAVVNRMPPQPVSHTVTYFLQFSAMCLLCLANCLKHCLQHCSAHLFTTELLSPPDQNRPPFSPEHDRKCLISSRRVIYIFMNVLIFHLELRSRDQKLLASVSALSLIFSDSHNCSTSCVLCFSMCAYPANGRSFPQVPAVPHRKVLFTFFCSQKKKTPLFL